MGDTVAPDGSSAAAGVHDQPRSDAFPVVYVRNPLRAHKIIPLLEDFDVHQVEGMWDIWNLRGALRERCVVLVDGFGRFGALGIAASAILQAPLVVRLRGDFFREARDRQTRSGIRGWLRYGATVAGARVCLWRSDALIYNSHYLQRVFRQHALRKPAAVVHNPYTARVATSNPESSPPALSGYRLLTITNMGLASKVDPIILAIRDWIPRSLWDELDIHWVICGDGRNRNRLLEAVSNLRLEHRVHVLGHVENSDAYYDWARVVVHLTHMDAFPNVPLEALMHERPVITNGNSCGTREIVQDRINGCVVDNAVEFVAALELYRSDDITNKHGAAGRAFVESTYSVSVQRQLMAEALRLLIPRTGKAPTTSG